MKNHFPSYLGLGILNPGSIIENKSEITAKYTLFGKTAHKVVFDNKSVTLWDYFEDELIGATVSSSLDQAVTNHFVNWEPSSDKRFEILQKKVCSLGNIHFEFPAVSKSDDFVMAFSPAGRLFIIRLVIPFYDIPLVERFYASEPDPGYNNQPVFTYNDMYHPTLVINMKNGLSVKEKIMLFEVSSPLAYIYEAVKWFIERELVRPEIEYRMIIQDIKEKDQESIKVFADIQKDGWSSYSIHFKGDRQDEKEFEKKDNELFRRDDD